MHWRGVTLNTAVNYGSTMQIAYYDSGSGSTSCGRGELHEEVAGDGRVVQLCLLETE